MDSGVARKPIADMRRLSPRTESAAQPDLVGAEPCLRGRSRQSQASTVRGRRGSTTSCAPRSRSRKAVMACRCWSAATTSTIVFATWASRSRKNMRCSTAAIRRLSVAPSISSTPRRQRHGMLRREVERMVNQDRNVFAAAMLALGEGDAMITGTTRPFSQSLREVRAVIDDEEGATPFGLNVVVGRTQTVLIADTAVTERPDRRTIRSDRNALRRICATNGSGSARRLHQLHDLRQPAGPPYRRIARRGPVARFD